MEFNLKRSPELLLTFVLLVGVGMALWSNHVHNDNMGTFAMSLARDAFIAITTLVVKGAVSSPPPPQ